MDRLQAAAILGVDPSATQEAIRKSFRARARIMHPDRFAAGNEDDHAAATVAMSQLNDAYAVLTAQDTLTSADFMIILCPVCGQKNRVANTATKANCGSCATALNLTSPINNESTDFNFPVWDYPDNACDICGWGPAQSVKYNSVAGNILWWRWFTFDAVLCRACSRAMFHENQASTMARGWWGILAPVATLIALIGNTYRYSATQSLQKPEGKSPQKYALIPYPIMFVKPAWQRPAAVIGTLIALSILIIVGLASGNSQPPNRDSSGTPTEAGTENILDINVGDCLPGSFTGDVTEADVVPCSEPHQYEVYANQELTYDGVYSETKVKGDVEIRCVAAFTSYIGLPFEESTLYFTYLYPTPDGWAQGDRGFNCLVTNADDSLAQTGSVKGSKI
jgi:ribosomal protein S27E